MPWNKWIPLQKFQIAHQVILFLIHFSWFFLYYINFLSMVKSLFMLGKIYFVHWGRYGFKQENPFKIFQIANQIILFCFIFMVYIFISKSLSKLGFFMWQEIFIIHWGSYGLKQGNPLQILKITNQIIIILSLFCDFYFYNKYLIKGKIFF